MATLCLNMIVKNESHIIESTLRNLVEKTPIDYWVISDTGSTDNTVEVIEATMAELGIPGEIFHDTWENFSHNRNLALEHATDKADYVLIFDADDYIDGDINWPQELTADAYHMNLTSENRDIFYKRLLVVKNRMAKWRGVLHEFLEIAAPNTIGDILGSYHVVSCRKGDRSRDEQKYLKDALLLKTALETNQDPDLRPRYLFYCAQSYMDAGMSDEGIFWYTERTKDATGWSEEIYVSHLRLGLAYEFRGEEEKAIYHWLLGTQVNPSRAECWYHLSRFNSWRGRHAVAYLFAQEAASKPMPSGALFVGTDIYDYWSNYEHFVNAYQTGRIEESYTAFKALAHSSAPDHLFIKAIDKVVAFIPYLHQDNYQQVLALKTALLGKGLSALVEVLGIS